MRNKKYDWAEAVHIITLIRDRIILNHPIIYLTTLCTQLSVYLPSIRIKHILKNNLIRISLKMDPFTLNHLPRVLRGFWVNFVLKSKSELEDAGTLSEQR